MKNILVLLVLTVGFTACNKEPEPLTKQQIQQKIDSITASRIKSLDAQAQQDLGRRIKIEVKVKADSILNAVMKQKATDTVKKAPALK